MGNPTTTRDHRTTPPNLATTRALRGALRWSSPSSRIDRRRSLGELEMLHPAQWETTYLTSSDRLVSSSSHLFHSPTTGSARRAKLGAHSEGRHKKAVFFGAGSEPKPSQKDCPFGRKEKGVETNKALPTDSRWQNCSLFTMVEVLNHSI